MASSEDKKRELLKVAFKPKEKPSSPPAESLKFEEPDGQQIVTIFDSSTAPAPFTNSKHYQQLQKRMEHKS
ncbi:uncharacterized protein AB675_3636 [Cyphellophora attinorum]|uniref:Uncharacterized protein n=1 Tax=Cyphellophora attinorum TaxID=1664694 RepID=A0A0N1H051_9EURO|nr:uncharacterized protein AB675_3636 [Phialophora attinorum]KPI37106.1 hypothetical protein AB675_3636 [Phialophora attinorum]